MPARSFATRPLASALPWVARAGVRARGTTLTALSIALAAVAPAASATPAGTPIANSARVAWVPEGSPGSPPAAADSNVVVTTVAAGVAFDPFLIEVAPAGTVPPGTPLTYTITGTNRSGLPLGGVVVRLAVDASLVEGEIVSPAPGTAATGATLAYDPQTRTLSWTLVDPVPAGGAFRLTFRTPVALSTAGGTLVTEQARETTALTAEEERSNTVVTPVLPPLLRLTLAADRPTIAPGDGVVFVMTVEHVGDELPLHGVTIQDALPAELRYVPGTTRVDGAPALDPEIGPGGRALRFAAPDLAIGGRHEIRFGARAAPAAREGEIVDRAFALGLTDGGLAATSPRVAASVRLIPGPFVQEATLVGRVFVDDDGDGSPGDAEPGVPGVLVLAENGRGAVTDVTGRWHLEGIRPGLHVIRIDPATLPPPLAPRSGGAAWAGEAASRFVEARASELEIVDLPVGPPRAPRCALGSLHGAVVLPEAVLGAGGGRADAALDAAAAYLVELGENAPRFVSVVCDGGAAPAPEIEAALRRRVAALAAVVETPAAAPAPSPSPPPKDPLEEVVRTAPAAAAIVFPQDGVRAPRSTTNVEVVYPQGSRLDLTLNGEPVPMDLVGATSTLPSRGISASRFIGLALRPGVNTIAFRATPPGGDPAAVAPVRITVVRPGPTVALAVEPAEAGCVADGTTPCTVRITALDEAGMRSGDEPMVTLVVEGARVIDADADPRTEGHQVRLAEGTASVRLAPPATPGRIRVDAEHDRATVERFLDAAPAAGPWRVLGLAEAHAAGPGGVEGDGGKPPGAVDDVTDDGARLAVLAQGPVLARSHLTVSIDTDRTADRYRLFDRFRPDAFFPVYGDSSGALDVAARQGPVYARLDGPAGFVALGDFDTAFTGTELARYDRRLPGTWGRVGNAKVTLDAFAASTDQTSVRDVFAPDGTSGPYLLGHRPVVAYSESVIVEVRDRFHPEDVIARSVKLPDLDYALDAEAGTILFRGPIAPFDTDLNPLRIVVLYETRGTAPTEVTGGARVVLHPTPALDAGATAVVEGHEGGDLGLYGLDVTWRAKPGTTIAAEAAASTQDGATHVATRFEAVSRTSDALRWEAHYHDVPAGFANPSYLSAPEIGGRRASGNVQWQSRGPWRLKGEALWQEDEIHDLRRTVGAVVAERRTAVLTLTGGLRGVASDDASGSVDSALAEVGVKGRLAPRWTAELFHAQVLTHDVAPGYPNRTGAGVYWDIRDGRRLVLKEEFESGGSVPAHARTVAGLESRIGPHTRALASYTIEGGASGTALRAASGIETVLPLSSKSSVDASASVVQTTRGDGSADFVVLGGGYEYRTGGSLVSGRYEVSFNHADVRHLLTASGVFRAGAPWMLFVREQVFVSDPKAGPVAARSEGLFGAAFRPVGGPLQLLVRLDHTLAGGLPVTPGGIAPGGVLSEPTASVSTSVADPVPPGLGTGYARAAPLASRDDVALNLATGYRIDRRNRLAATLTFRRAGAEADTGIGASSTWLLALHYTAQVAERWTLGASLRRFAQVESRAVSFGEGIEVGYLAFRNLWVTGGLNVAGFSDGGFPDADRTERGPFVGLRFKFDERSLASIQDLRLDRP